MCRSLSSLYLERDLRVFTYTLARKTTIWFCRSYCIEWVEEISVALSVLSVVARRSDGTGGSRECKTL